MTSQNEDFPFNSGKKVVLLVSFMNVAGAQEAAMRVTRSMRSMGYETEIWFFYNEEKMSYEDRGIRIIFDRPRLSPFQYFTLPFRLTIRLRKAKPDAVISFLPLANAAGQLSAKLAGVNRRIASQRSPFNTYSRPMRIADKLMSKLGIYTDVIAVSQAVADSLSGHASSLQRRIQVVHNGLDWTPSRLSKNEARQKFGLSVSDFLALSVGRMKSQKNYPFQTEIAAGLTNSRIIVAGDGPERPQIEKKLRHLGAQDRMILLGNVAKIDIPDLLKAADCFIQPSLYEGQSNALLEAMHAGVPVLVSNTPSQKETVLSHNGVSSGIVLDLDDPLDWSKAIDALAANPSRLKSYAVSAYDRAQDFHLDKQKLGFASVVEGRRWQDPDLISPSRSIPSRPHNGCLNYLSTHHSSLVRSWQNGQESDQSLQDDCDLIYSLFLLGWPLELPQQSVDAFATKVSEIALAGGLTKATDTEPINVHNTAYVLASLCLLQNQGYKISTPFSASQNWSLDEIVDFKTARPIWPRQWSHHSWRVSHWIGGTASILQSLSVLSGEQLKQTGAPSVGETLVAIDKLISAKTGFLECYKFSALQALFKTAYRIRHDPILGEVGGVAHPHWVNYHTDRALKGGGAVFQTCMRALIDNHRFMESVPYCLDFDVVQLARITQRFGNEKLRKTLKKRSRKFANDIISFLDGIPADRFTLHKLPGALATCHECALIDPTIDLSKLTNGKALMPIDIMKEVSWL